MEPTPDELARHYAEMDLPELQLLAQSRDQLTPDAHEALLAEFGKRAVAPDDIVLQEEEQFKDSGVWITVERFRDLSAAIVARGALEAADIPCFLRDENTVRLDWQISNFIGGMQLQVPADELAAAQAVLSGLGSDEDSNGVAEESLPDERCPRCGSTAISRKPRRRGLAIALVWLFGLPISPGAPEWTCEQCGQRWTEPAAKGT